MITKVTLKNGTTYTIGDETRIGKVTEILMRYIPEMNDFVFSVCVEKNPYINIMKSSIQMWFETKDESNATNQSV